MHSSISLNLIVIVATCIFTENLFSQASLIRGSVHDSKTSEPLSGVVIGLSNSETEVITDHAGLFELSSHLYGLMVLSFHKPEYK